MIIFIILFLLSNYVLADSSTDQVKTYERSSVYVVGCTQGSPGQYKYIEKSLNTINDNVSEYLKENPDQVAPIKKVSLIMIAEFKKMSSTEKYIICDKIDDRLREFYYPIKE